MRPREFTFVAPNKEHQFVVEAVVFAVRALPQERAVERLRGRVFRVERYQETVVALVAQQKCYQDDELLVAELGPK